MVLGEIKRLSSISGLKEDVIKEEIEGYIKAGKSPEGAIAIWKANNERQLQGQIQDLVFRVLRVGDVYTFNRRTDGSKVQATRLDVVMLNDGVPEVRNITLYGEDIAKSSGIIPGNVYESRGRVMFNSSRIFLEDGATIKPSSARMPSMKEMLSEIAKVDLNNLENYAGTTQIFKVFVGRAIDSGGARGMVVASLGSNPVTCWLRNDNLAIPEEGSEVLIYGYVTNKGTINVDEIIEL